MTKEILLRNGDLTLVSDEDFEWLSQWEWSASKNRLHTYASRQFQQNKKKVKVYMHRLILGASSEDVVDHINGNSLDNRRENLRLATYGLNNANAALRRDNTSGYRGVSKDKRRGNWRAEIHSNGKYIYLGAFPTRDKARDAYQKAAERLFGDYRLCVSREKSGLGGA